MEKIIFVVLSVLCLSYSVFSLSSDQKARFAEKEEIIAVKEGVTYFLALKGIEMVNIGEDFAVWLKNLESSFQGDNLYDYSITYPTMLTEKRTSMEEALHFKIRLNAPIKRSEEVLDNRLKKYIAKMKECLTYETYISDLAVATCIEELLIAKGVLRKR